MAQLVLFQCVIIIVTEWRSTGKSRLIDVVNRPMDAQGGPKRVNVRMTSSNEKLAEKINK